MLDLLPVNAFQGSKADGGYGFDGYVYCFDLSLRTTPIVVEPITIDPSLVLFGVAIVPPFFAGVFMVIIYQRMKRDEKVVVMVIVENTPSSALASTSSTKTSVFPFLRGLPTLQIIISLFRTF